MRDFYSLFAFFQNIDESGQNPFTGFVDYTPAPTLLLSDAATEAHIRGEWQQLMAAGLPSQGRHSGISNRPHITLAVARQLTAEQEIEWATAARGVVPSPTRSPAQR